MKMYYVENYLESFRDIEQFYLLETDFGCFEISLNEYITAYSSMRDFKNTWKNFNKYAIMIRVF